MSTSFYIFFEKKKITYRRNCLWQLTTYAYESKCKKEKTQSNLIHAQLTPSAGGLFIFELL